MAGPNGNERRTTACLVLMLTVIVAACAGPAPSPSPAEPSPPDELARASELYIAHCQACHGDAEGRGGTGAAPPHTAEGHTWHHPDAELKEWVMHGKPFTAMPGFADELTEEEVDAILTLIKTWWTEEQRAQQADVSRRHQEMLERQSPSP
jgi:mono/diheme cytochrome c family protein